MKEKDILKIVEDSNVRFMRMQFTDLHGILKNVEVPRSQFKKALAGEIMFDGSSIQGFTRIEESDMLLIPDLSTFQVNPWSNPDGSKVGRIFCDVYLPDGTPFAGCPRMTLKRQVERAKKMGYTMVAGPEAEFFLFNMNDKGEAILDTHDVGGYFDLGPADMGEQCRRDIVMVLEEIGFEVEAAHHEVAPGQHEIDFKYGEAVSTADKVVTFRFVVKKVARDHGLHASFMPKPIFGENGSGMHVHMSLFNQKGKNVFFDPKGEHQMSKLALNYIGGLLRHSEALVAVTNPLVNSYKRLVPGYEAPINVAWSEKNRSPLIRVPAKRGASTRCEMRVPDPAANPYLALAVMLAAGLDGIEKKVEAGEPVNKNIFTMSKREKKRLKIRQLPGDLSQAMDALEKNSVIMEALGPHIAESYLAAKRQEWFEYISHVHTWEQDRYLSAY